MTDEPSKGISEKFSKFHEAMMSVYGEDIYNAWLSDLLIEDVTTETVTLATTSKFKCERINAQYKPNLQRLFESKVDSKKLSIVPSKGLSKFAAKIDRLGTPQKFGSLPNVYMGEAAKIDGGTVKGEFGGKVQNRAEKFEVALNANAKFVNFASDASNRMALAAAHQVFLCDDMREVIYIHGPSGCGKTHLMNAIGNKWIESFGRDEVISFTFDGFKDLCAEAAQDGWLGELKRDLSTYRCILVDDIHLLVTAKRSMKELLNLVNNVAGTDVQLVLAGDRAPSRLIDCGVDVRFADRLSGGYAVQMSHGDENLRAEVLRKRVDAGQHHCLISETVISFIARYFPQSMREALGALNQLTLHFGAEPITVTEEMAREVLKERLVDRRRQATLGDLLNVASEVTGQTVDELTGRAQGQRYVKPRHAYVMVAREGLNESFPRIAAELGRDHTTMISSYRRAQDLYARDQGFREWVSGMNARLGL